MPIDGHSLRHNRNGRSVIEHFRYLHEHVFRTMEFDIKFALTRSAKIHIIERAPTPFSPQSEIAFFFMNTYGRDYSKAFLVFEGIKERLLSLKDSPATANEFNAAHVQSCETVGHVIRCNACFEPRESERRALFNTAISIYEGVIHAARHPSFIHWLKKMNKRPGQAQAMRPLPLDCLLPLPFDLRRVIADTFAGMALCYLNLGDEGEPRFVSCMSGSVVISSSPLELAATLRHFPLMMTQIASSEDEGLKYRRLMLKVTHGILLPTMLREGRQDLFDFEMEIVQDRGMCPQIERLAIGLTQGTGRARVVGFEIVEHKCAACGDASKCSRCSRCGLVYYCGKECQRAHWKEHKAACRK